MTDNNLAGRFKNNTADGGFGPFDRTEFKNLVAQVFACTGPLTALAGGGQAGATQCNPGLNLVATAGVGGTDSVVLPLALPGMMCTVQNDSTNAIQVFGQVSNPFNVNAATGNPIGDTIAGFNSSTYQPTATGITQAASTVSEYFCIVLGKWKQAQT